jgi:hypothetical protein
MQVESVGHPHLYTHNAQLLLLNNYAIWRNPLSSHATLP